MFPSGKPSGNALGIPSGMDVGDAARDALGNVSVVSVIPSQMTSATYTMIMMPGMTLGAASKWATMTSAACAMVSALPSGGAVGDDIGHVEGAVSYDVGDAARDGIGDSVGDSAGD